MPHRDPHPTTIATRYAAAAYLLRHHPDLVAVLGLELEAARLRAAWSRLAATVVVRGV